MTNNLTVAERVAQTRETTELIHAIMEFNGETFQQVLNLADSVAFARGLNRIDTLKSMLAEEIEIDKLENGSNDSDDDSEPNHFGMSDPDYYYNTYC